MIRLYSDIEFVVAFGSQVTSDSRSSSDLALYTRT